MNSKPTIASEIQTDIDPNSLAELLKRDLRARHVDGMVHNINSTIQIIAGQVALLHKAYPDEARCTKVLRGVEQITALTAKILRLKATSNDLGKVAKDACETFNALCRSSEAREISVKGGSLLVNSAAATLFEAYLMRVLDSIEPKGRCTLIVNAEANLVTIEGIGPPVSDIELEAAMAAGGIELEFGNELTLVFQSAAFEGM
ncbi:MAG: hypothetical protein KDB07_01085 [Planctomycetes bacterium]|nr:hypothetical protein [Planctomycetota bacterium]